MKRPALQNKWVEVLRMAFRTRKVFGTFEKQAPAVVIPLTFKSLYIPLHIKRGSFDVRETTPNVDPCSFGGKLFPFNKRETQAIKQNKQRQVGLLKKSH